MTFLGEYYYQQDYFPITDEFQPGHTYERALEQAAKHGGTYLNVRRAYNDAGGIIGWIVRSRHYVGAPGCEHPDKVKDKDAGRT